MSVIRLRRKSHFVAVSNDTARSKALSLQAKGLLMVMLSFPDDWDFNLSHIEGNSRNGRDSHRTALKELIAAGYAKWRTVQDEHGKLQGRELLVSDEPTLRDRGTGKPSDGGAVGRKNRRTENPTVGKPEATKNYFYEEPLHEVRSSPAGDTREVKTREIKVRGAGRSDIQQVVDAYNNHRGTLPAAQALNSWRERKIRGLIRDLKGDVNEAIAVMGIAAAEVAGDEFWQRRRYGLDNLLRERRAIQKAETAVSRGTTDREQAEVDRMLAALGPN